MDPAAMKARLTDIDQTTADIARCSAGNREVQALAFTIHRLVVQALRLTDDEQLAASVS